MPTNAKRRSPNSNTVTIELNSPEPAPNPTNERVEIVKVKIDSKTSVPIIWYESPTQFGDKEVTHKGNTPAHSDLLFAMNQLTGLAISSCRLSEDWNDAGAETKVINVSFKSKEDGIGLNITLLGKFSEGDATLPVVINSPFLSGDFLDRNIQSHIQLIHKEAKAYLNGKSAQGNLFDQTAA